jgi:hypothetical protein
LIVANKNMLKMLPAENFVPFGHPVKGKSLRDGYAALDMDPTFGNYSRIGSIFTHKP